MTTPDDPPPPADEINRLWQHGMHEERLFHDRLNYFSFLDTGLLTICAVMYNKEPAVGFFLPVAVIGLLFTLLWLTIQTRHWSYCEHLNARIRRLVPEYKALVEGMGGRRAGFSISKPLALAVPCLFVATWLAFLVWLLVRDRVPPTAEGVTPERVGLAALTVVVVWLVLRVKRLERR